MLSDLDSNIKNIAPFQLDILIFNLPIKRYM